MKKIPKIQYNSPVVLTFSLLSLLALGLNQITGGQSNHALFSVYRAPLADPLTYLRLFLHVLGHSGIAHYMGNILMLLVAGPPLEEKYGSLDLLLSILITAAVSGLVQMLFFPGSALLGASGIVFMMIVMSSLAGMEDGKIPLTLILVVLLYLGRELLDMVFQKDNISQLSHIIGGLCGAGLGLVLKKAGSGQTRR